MPFGQRKFITLEHRLGSHRAIFYPFDLGSAHESVDEITLRKQLEANDALPAPLDDIEEVTALRAFEKLVDRRPSRKPNRTPIKPKVERRF